MGKRYSGTLWKGLEEAHGSLVCVTGVKGRPKPSVVSLPPEGVSGSAAAGRSKARQCCALGWFQGGECAWQVLRGSNLCVFGWALQGLLGSAALGCPSLCAEFCFGFVFVSPLKAL